jgi:hypothetical protein
LSYTRLTFRVGRRKIHKHANPPRLRRLLCPHGERPSDRRTAHNGDKFPSPHGFARAEDHIGYEKIITFLD